ncbi:MAG: hypothetical protein R6U27_15235 [Desulfobacterales bacterium]
MVQNEINLDLLTKPHQLKKHIARVLEKKNRKERFVPKHNFFPPIISSVLVLLGNYSQNGAFPEPSIILNKRSKRVKQAGDLCFPGGAIEPNLDPYLSKIMAFPGLPISRWPYWPLWKKQRPLEARWISLMMATSIRESFEEMKLNPLLVNFLGPMSCHCLRMFKKEIYPMVGWGCYQKRFYPNREVDKIVIVSLRSLLNFDNYARFRISYPPRIKKERNRDFEDFPCFVLKSPRGTETLWGVTFRIITAFVSAVFGFKLPDMQSLDMVSGVLDDNYLDNS